MKVVFKSDVQKFLRISSFYKVKEAEFYLIAGVIDGKGAKMDFGWALLGLLMNVKTFDAK